MNDLPPVLDVCCGPRMFWFDKADSRALYNDIRSKSYICKDVSSKPGFRFVNITPQTQFDFRDLPFPPETFSHVVFDPPHLTHCGKSSWLIKKYGKLGDNWKEDIREGFGECFRVLKPGGTLVFKWNETEIRVSEILKLTAQSPLYGHKSGKHSKTHWIVFVKEEKKGSE